MITKETARRIYNAYSEIENCDKLMKDMKEALATTGEPKLMDGFGHRRGLELGVPSGSSGHRIFQVPPELAVQVIEVHRQKQEELLKELRSHAIIELKG